MEDLKFRYYELIKKLFWCRLKFRKRKQPLIMCFYFITSYFFHIKTFSSLFHIIKMLKTLINCWMRFERRLYVALPGHPGRACFPICFPYIISAGPLIYTKALYLLK